LRKHLISKLIERARVDEAPFLVVGDLGYGVIEPFKDEFPDRYLNVGVAEQAGIGISAGLSRSYLPFFYSIGNFPSMRALEQIRNDVAHEDNPVVVVSLGAGFSYGPAGYSHHAIEDAGAVASIMGMTVFTPACVHELDEILSSTWLNPRPMYLRLGSNETCAITHQEFEFEFCSVWQQGSSDTVIVAHGEIVQVVAEAVRGLEPSPTVLTISQFNADQEQLALQLKGYEQVVTVEEHFVEGGFGTRIASALANTPAQISRLGVRNYDSHVGGSPQFMREQNSLDAESIREFLVTFGYGRT